MVTHHDEIMNRPKKSWFQSQQEKRATRELNPASGRRLDPSKPKGQEEAEEDEDGLPVISKKKVITCSKKDKYAGMSRQKRRRAIFREEEEEDKKQEQREREAAGMFSEDGKKTKGPKKVLSQRAAKSAVRHGKIDPEQQKLDAKKRRTAIKRKRSMADDDHAPKRVKNDKELFQEAVDAELSATRKGSKKKNNKKQAKATNKSFKSKKRMKRR